MTNQEVRRAARAAGVPLWKVADALGVSEPTVTRWLRRELPNEKKTAMLAAIERLGEEVER